VASHYGYTEEYVLSHTPEWLARKSKQAAQEKIDEHRMRIVEGFKGLALFMDMAFNKGREIDEILPPPLKRINNEKKVIEQGHQYFVEKEWWKTK
jgi:hypothetical protein